MGKATKTQTWQEISAAQEGAISFRQLRDIGVTRAAIRHHLMIGRWAQRSSEVLTTTTGPLSVDQRLWVAALHAGGDSLIGGLSATSVHGMKNWHRDDITVLVNNPLSLEPLEGVTFFRTRRDLSMLSAPTALPLCRLEPAVLLFSGYEFNQRTAHGAVAAVVQQRLTTPAQLRSSLTAPAPLRRAREFRLLLDDLEGGAQSLAEVDVKKACREFEVAPPTSQTRRRDRAGRTRFTDCEWRLPDGRTVALEVDGSFHDDVIEASEHRARNRKLTTRPRGGRAVQRLRDPARAVGSDGGPHRPRCAPGLGSELIESSDEVAVSTVEPLTRLDGVSARRRTAGRRRHRGRARCSPSR